MSLLASTNDLSNIIIVIALIVMMTKAMEDMGTDRLMVAPIRGLLGNAYISYWVIGLAMLVLSWFIWPTPAAPLLGALVVPLAIASGLPPMIAAMSMSIFGKGVGLSSDFVIQGMPAVTAKMTGLPVEQIIATSIPAWATVSVVAIVVSYVFAVRSIRRSRRAEQDGSGASGSDGSMAGRLQQIRSDIPAVTHIDYSARVQTVDRAENPFLHAVLTEFDRMTGCPVMINTSFNVRGEPPVGHPREALDGFFATGMDTLALGSFLIEKRSLPPVLLNVVAPARTFVPD